MNSIWKAYLTNAKNMIYEMNYFLSYNNHMNKNKKCKSFQEIIKNYLTNAKTWSMQWTWNHALFLGCDSVVL